MLQVTSKYWPPIPGGRAQSPLGHGCPISGKWGTAYSMGHRLLGCMQKRLHVRWAFLGTPDSLPLSHQLLCQWHTDGLAPLSVAVHGVQVLQSPPLVPSHCNAPVPGLKGGIRSWKRVAKPGELEAIAAEVMTAMDD